MFSNHVFCTSVKCASTVACFTPLVGLCREISENGREEGRFFFDPQSKHGQTADIIAAFSIVTRGGINPMLKPPTREVVDIVNDREHPVHACYRALTERDRLHEICRKMARGNPTIKQEGYFDTNHTPLAAALAANGFPEMPHYHFDGQSVTFSFGKNDAVQTLANAFNAAWATLTLDFNHPIYWMKACLQKREEILKKYNECPQHYAERKGHGDSFKIIMTPLSATKEQLEKAKQYI